MGAVRHRTERRNGVCDRLDGPPMRRRDHLGALQRGYLPRRTQILTPSGSWPAVRLGRLALLPTRASGLSAAAETNVGHGASMMMGELMIWRATFRPAPPPDGSHECASRSSINELPQTQGDCPWRPALSHRCQALPSSPTLPPTMAPAPYCSAVARPGRQPCEAAASMHRPRQAMIARHDILTTDPMLPSYAAQQ